MWTDRYKERVDLDEAKFCLAHGTVLDSGHQQTSESQLAGQGADVTALGKADAAPLTGCRILVVEDEFLIADELARVLAGEGAEILGPAPTVDQAMAVASDQPIHAAVMDINLGGTLAWPLVDLLLARSVPVTLVTGYDGTSVPAQYGDLPRWAKPVALRELAEALARQFTATNCLAPG